MSTLAKIQERLDADLNVENLRAAAEGLYDLVSNSPQGALLFSETSEATQTALRHQFLRGL